MNGYEERVAAAIRGDGDGGDYFPRWKDPACEHPLEAIVKDGAGWICGECGKTAWL